MIRQLRAKLVAIIMAFVAVILVCVMTAVLGLTRATLERESLDMMRHIALDPSSRPPPPAKNLTACVCLILYFQWPRMARSNLRAAVTMICPILNFLQQAAEEAVDSGAQSGMLADSHLRFLRLETDSGNFIVFADTSNETQTLTGLLHTCLLLCGAAFAAFFLVSILLARWAVRPVETAWTQQKQFVADASHELKTPLTVLLTDAELLCTPEGEYDIAEKRKLSQSMLTVAQQMRVLVEQLLELARVEQGLPPRPARAAELERERQ